jgi:hypothetical protein
MQKDDVSQTFVLNTTGIKTTVSDTATGKTDEMPISLLSLATQLATQPQEITTADDETISKDLQPSIGEVKNIPTPDQNNLLRGLLYETALLADTQKASNQAEYDTVTQKVKEGIQQLYKGFDGTYNSNLPIQQNISTLITLLQGYDIPPTYIANLDKISSEITRISQIEQPEESLPTENATK